MNSARDHLRTRATTRVIITGVGVETCAGVGPAGVGFPAGERPASWAAFAPWIHIAAGNVETSQSLLPNRKLMRLLSRGVYWGVVAAMRAFRDSGLDRRVVEPSRLGVFVSGYNNYDELCHPYSLLRKLRERGEHWRDGFCRASGELPAFTLLRQLPNAAAHHISQAVQARGYNATLMGGTACGLDLARMAALGIHNGRLDAALVVCFDSPLGWARLVPIARAFELYRSRDPMVVGEGGIALVLERENRPRGDSVAYARFISGASRHCASGVVSMTKILTAPPRDLADTMRQAARKCMETETAGPIHCIEVSDLGVSWLDDAEQEAVLHFGALKATSGTPLTGHLGYACGAAGLARACYALRGGMPLYTGLVLRASVSGQCSACLLQAA